MKDRKIETRDRDYGIELMRIIMMFGVCVLHTAHLGVPFKILSANSLLWAFFVCSVDGFVFISGYYGIKFRPSKILSLYCIGFFCALLNLVGLVSQGQPFKFSTYCIVEHLFCGTWFLHAYVVLMCFAPALDKCFNSNDKKSALAIALPLVTLVFVWTWFADEFKVLKMPFPTSTGFGSHTWLTLLGVYVVARLCRIIKFDRLIKPQLVLIAIPILTTVTAFYRGALGSYNSPQIIILTVLVFWLFKHVRISPLWIRVTSLITPSLFAVYLLHYGSFGRLLYERLICLRHIDGIPVVMASLIIATVVFALSLLVDIPRRLVVKMFAQQIEVINKRVDDFYQKVLEKVSFYV